MSNSCIFYDVCAFSEGMAQKNIVFSNSNKNRNNNIKNNFHKTCINTPIESNRKKEQITQLTKELQNKSNQINIIKMIIMIFLNIILLNK